MDAALQDRPDYASGVDWIDRHVWFDAVGRDIAGRAPFGSSCDELDTFDDIEGEMMKRGTLQHSQIRWDWVAGQCCDLLREQVKDLRLLVYLVHSAPYCVTDEEPLALASALSARFLLRWGSDTFPKGKAKLNQLARLVHALETLTGNAAAAGIRQDVKPIIVSALKDCSNVVAELAPDLGIRLAVLPSRLEAAPKETSQAQGGFEAQTAEESVAKPGLKKGPVSAISAASPRSENLRLDVTNERALKQSLMVVADFLLDLDVAHPLSYRLRRFATWFGITSAPAIKSGERTVIPAVSEDLADQYRIAAERGQSSEEIAKKVERFCHLQPFWIEGQWFAWQLARACGRLDVAEAVRAETSRFVSSLKALPTLKFSDGSPIVPVEVADWLRSGRDEQSPVRPSAGAEGSGILQSARESARAGNIGSAIEALEGARPQGSGQRAAVLWEVQVLEALSDWGLKSHAGLQAGRVAASIIGVAVPEWEPDLMDRLKRLQG